jgi:hypothetical protein
MFGQLKMGRQISEILLGRMECNIMVVLVAHSALGEPSQITRQYSLISFAFSLECIGSYMSASCFIPNPKRSLH